MTPEPKGVARYRCPKHKQWMRKGQCEICLLERDARQREWEKTGGKNKPAVKIGKL